MTEAWIQREGGPGASDSEAPSLRGGPGTAVEQGTGGGGGRGPGKGGGGVFHRDNLNC